MGRLGAGAFVPQRHPDRPDRGDRRDISPGGLALSRSFIAVADTGLIVGRLASTVIVIARGP